MIWPKKIHLNREIHDWVGHADCGFPASVIALLKQDYNIPDDLAPVEYVQKRPIVFVPHVEDIKKVIRVLKGFSCYTDTAFWVNARGIRDAIFRLGESEWMDMPFRQAYVECDILVVDDVPRGDRSDPNYKDAIEINYIIKDRLSRQRKLTIILGDDLAGLSAVTQYKELRKLQGYVE
jgi:hypothetical protein